VEPPNFFAIQMSLQRGINLRALAEKMGQCSGAEVRGICTEAGSYLPFEGNISPGDKKF
jgi:ATP-dependent 26S proteasome regulatory subunit